MRILFISLMLLCAAAPAKANQELTNYFFAAAKTGQTEVLNEFLEKGFPINLRNSQSYTALMMATYHGQKEAVDILLHHGADTCLKDKRGHTAMMAAVVKAEWTIARILYKKDCHLAHSTEKTLEEFARVFGQTEKLKALKTEKQMPE